MVGVGSIGLTILVTYGLCSGFGLFFGPMHNVIPFLFLGIGKLFFWLQNIFRHPQMMSSNQRNFVTLKTRQVYNLFQHLWNKFISFFSKRF